MTKVNFRFVYPCIIILPFPLIKNTNVNGLKKLKSEIDEEMDLENDIY